MCARCRSLTFKLGFLLQVLFKRPEDPIVFLRDVLNHKIQQVSCASAFGALAYLSLRLLSTTPTCTELLHSERTARVTSQLLWKSTSSRATPTP